MQYLLYLVKSYYRKKLFSHISDLINERALTELSNALFRGAVALLVSELCADL